MRSSVSSSSKTLLVLSLAGLIGVAAACSTSTSGKAAKGSASAPTEVSVGPTSAPSVTPAATSATRSAATPTPTKKPTVQRLTAALRTKTVDVGTATFVVTIWAEDSLQDCRTHAYGAPVIAFLTVHPCQETHRQLLTLPLNGKEVGVSIIQTSFEGSSPDNPYDNAHQFTELVQRDGTGNINDLLREGKVLPRGPVSIPASDAFRVLGQDSGVVIFDFWYTSGATPKNAPELVALADVLFLNTFG